MINFLRILSDKAVAFVEGGVAKGFLPASDFNGMRDSDRFNSVT